MRRSIRTFLLAGTAAAAPATADRYRAAITLADFGWDQGWRTDRHVRETGDVNGDGRADVVGFGEGGVHLAYGHDDATLSTSSLKLRDFGWRQGWRTDRHPREVSDVNADGKADVVGFGNRGLFLSFSGANGTFGVPWGPETTVENFGADHGWRTDRHLRELADLNGDDRLDIVGFGNAGVLASSATPAGSMTIFSTATLRLADFGWNHGWRTDRHPRELADVTGDGVLDIVGFGDAGVLVAQGRADGTFAAPVLGVQDFGWDQGWRLDRHPRHVADVDADGRGDIVGFGDAEVWVAYSGADGTFAAPVLAAQDFGPDQGWQVGRHPRVVLDLNLDARTEIIGFGTAGTYFAYGQPDDVFAPVHLEIRDYGWGQGWRTERHVRQLTDVTGDRRPDIVGFGEGGTFVTPLLTGAGTAPW